jgi:peptide/nickel transport system substrate-binding protein
LSRALRLCATTTLQAAIFAAFAVADEPKHGGILRIYHRDSPASASLHEEATFSANVPFMGIFNNLVLYEVPQNSLDSIVPELATRWA